MGNFYEEKNVKKLTRNIAAKRKERERARERDSWSREVVRLSFTLVPLFSSRDLKEREREREHKGEI